MYGFGKIVAEIEEEDCDCEDCEKAVEFLEALKDTFKTRGKSLSITDKAAAPVKAFYSWITGDWWFIHTKLDLILNFMKINKLQFLEFEKIFKNIN